MGSKNSKKRRDGDSFDVPAKGKKRALDNAKKKKTKSTASQESDVQKKYTDAPTTRNVRSTTKGPKSKSGRSVKTINSAKSIDTTERLPTGFSNETGIYQSSAHLLDDDRYMGSSQFAPSQVAGRQNSGPYPDADGRYPDVNGRYPDVNGRYPDGKYADANGRYPVDALLSDTNGRYQDADGNYPDASGMYPDGRFADVNGRYPDTKNAVVNGIYPDANGNRPNADGRYPDVNGRYPDAIGRYPDGKYADANGRYPVDDIKKASKSKIQWDSKSTYFDPISSRSGSALPIGAIGMAKGTFDQTSMEHRQVKINREAEEEINRQSAFMIESIKNYRDKARLCAEDINILTTRFNQLSDFWEGPLPESFILNETEVPAIPDNTEVGILIQAIQTEANDVLDNLMGDEQIRADRTAMADDILGIMEDNSEFIKQVQKQSVFNITTYETVNAIAKQCDKKYNEIMEQACREITTLELIRRILQDHTVDPELNTNDLHNKLPSNSLQLEDVVDLMINE